MINLDVITVVPNRLFQITNLNDGYKFYVVAQNGGHAMIIALKNCGEMSADSVWQTYSEMLTDHLATVNNAE